MDKRKGFAKLISGTFQLQWALFEHNKRVKIIKFKRGIMSNQKARLRKMGYTIKRGYTHIHNKTTRDGLELTEL